MEATVGGGPPTVFLRTNGNVSYDPEPAVAPDGSAIAYVYDGGQVLGINGPSTEYRVAVHPLPDTGGHFYRVDGGYVGKLQWVGGAQAFLFDVESAGQTELYLSDVDGHTTKTGMRLGAGFDWHS